MTLGLGAAVSISVVKGAQFGKIRNKNVVIELSIFGSLLACYFVWFESQVFIFNPIDLFALIQIVAEKGVWSMCCNYDGNRGLSQRSFL